MPRSKSVGKFSAFVRRRSFTDALDATSKPRQPANATESSNKRQELLSSFSSGETEGSGALQERILELESQLEDKDELCTLLENAHKAESAALQEKVALLEEENRIVRELARTPDTEYVAKQRLVSKLIDMEVIHASRELLNRGSISMKEFEAIVRKESKRHGTKSFE